MKSINSVSNNHSIKRYFKCDKCQNLYSKTILTNIKIKCDKCGDYNLREISERDYQAQVFNYINGNQKNKYKKSNTNNDMNNKLIIDQKNKMNMATNNLNNNFQRYNTQINSNNNNINPNVKINIDNNLRW